jgi:glycosyltransferase involved in cell wall biosynthesis
MTTIADAELIIVTPIYNEEATIRQVLRSWLDEMDRLGIQAVFYAINDGSRDRTQEVLQDFRTREPDRLIVFEKPNSGHGRSCRVGYDRACETNVEWVLQIDSDGQCDPRYFAAFWEAREKADCVLGFRATHGAGLTRQIVSRICTTLAGLITSESLLDANSPYRLVRRSVLRRALELVPPDFNVHNVALTVALKRDKRNRFVRIPIHFPARQGGENSMNIPKIIRMGLRMLLDLKRVGRPRNGAEAKTSKT